VFGNRAGRDQHGSVPHLIKFAWTPIIRHQMVMGTASPDDPGLTDYWAARRLGNDLDDQAGSASADGGHRRFSDQNRRPCRTSGGLEDFMPDQHANSRRPPTENPPPPSRAAAVRLVLLDLEREHEIQPMRIATTTSGAPRLGDIPIYPQTSLEVG
jgi:hypothetical protein